MNYYELLEIREDASQEVVNMAYKALCRKYHPDVNNGDPEAANWVMSQLNEAYEVLSDPEKRAAYDASLKDEEQKAQVQESNAKGPGMHWLSFYVNVFLVLGIISGCISVIRTFANTDMREILLSGESYSLPLVISTVIQILYIILLAYLAIGLRHAGAKVAYNVNMFFLAIFPAIAALNGLFTDDRILYIASGAIFSILNIIYFQKRSFLYLYLRPATVGRALKMVLCTVLISGSIIYGLYALVGDSYVAGQQGTQEPASIYDITDEEATNGIEELALVLGWDSVDEFVDFVSDEADVDFDSLSPREQYDYITSDLMEFPSYEETVGQIENPFTETMVEDFDDYQNLIIDSIEAAYEEE